MYCCSCSRDLPDSEFYANQKNCKSCAREYKRVWRASHPGYDTRKSAEWYKAHPDARRAKERRKYQNRKRREGLPDAVNLTAEEKALRAACRVVWRTARKRGKIVPQPCERCGESNADGHHEDYTQPLVVIWLCRPCHVAEHKRFRAK
jgi:hypothetical protein